MLLALDIGNTNVTLGLFEENKLRQCWRLETVHTRTEDEYGLALRQLLALDNCLSAQISCVIIASVVPALTRTMSAVVHKLFHLEAMVVGPGLRTGMPILYNPPKDVGADRIVNGVAAYARFGAACVVVDFGTATTFDAITSAGEYAGGAIVPGINISLDALFRQTAKLPRVEFARPAQAIGRTTIESIQSGTYFGYAALVDGMVRRIVRELGADPRNVVATGGLAPLIVVETETISVVDEALTLEGLRILYTLNTGN